MIHPPPVYLKQLVISRKDGGVVDLTFCRLAGRLAPNMPTASEPALEAPHTTVADDTDT